MFRIITTVCGYILNGRIFAGKSKIIQNLKLSFRSFFTLAYFVFADKDSPFRRDAAIYAMLAPDLNTI